MKQTIALTALVAAAVACSSCAPAEKRPAGRDTAADTTAADTTQATEIPESRLAALGADADYKGGFYKVKNISTSSLETDTIIQQRMRTDPGWVYPKVLVLEDTAAAPELVVRADSFATAPMVAYVDFVTSDQGGWESRYAVNDSTLYGELARLSDDEYGMTALGVKGSWARVIYGYTSTGERRVGWVKLVPGKIEYTTEQQELDE